MASATAPTRVLVNPAIGEGSGIADSKTHPGKLWVIEDSGNPAELILLGRDGSSGPRLAVPGAVNRDWEDLVLAGGFLYIGDIGDNEQKADNYTIYKMPEPAAGATSASDVAAIPFRYADGPHDAEGFLVDPQSGDIYLITKRDAAAQVYRIAAGYSTTTQNVAERVATLGYNGVVSTALSPDGQLVVVKTYDTIYAYKRTAGAGIASVWAQQPVTLPYKGEPQGEAICFKKDGTGYFTLSEQLLGSDVFLYFYKLP